MRVAIDATSLLEPPTGIGRVTRSTIEALVTHTDLDVSCFAVTWRGRGRLAGACPDGATPRTRPIPARLAHAAWRYVPLPWAEQLTGPVDVVHSPNYVVPPPRRAASVVSVHDLTFIHHPEWCAEAVLGFPRLIQRAIDRGAWVHTGAEAIATEIREHFAVDPDKVVAIHHGLDKAVVNAGGDTRPPTVDGRYVLALGTIEPRKDLATLVDAFDRGVAEAHPDLRLVIAGGEGWAAEAYHRALDAAHHRDRILTLGYVDDRDRRSLLTNATVLAYPSRYEGFGLPPLEAMQADVPVVTTDAGSLPEIVGGAAEIAPVGDVDGLARAIDNALEPTRRTELVAAGRINVRRFDWATTAAALEQLYRRAASA